MKDNASYESGCFDGKVGFGGGVTNEEDWTNI